MITIIILKNTTRIFWLLVCEGRQYIKDVLVDGQSHLLIIREETELPGAQVSEVGLAWASSEPQYFFFPNLHDRLLFSPAHSVGQLGGRRHPGLQFGKWVQFPGSLQNLPPAGRPQARVGDRLRRGGHSGWVMPRLRLSPRIVWEEAKLIFFVLCAFFFFHDRQDQQQQSSSHRWRQSPPALLRRPTLHLLRNLRHLRPQCKQSLQWRYVGVFPKVKW